MQLLETLNLYSSGVQCGLFTPASSKQLCCNLFYNPAVNPVLPYFEMDKKNGDCICSCEDLDTPALDTPAFTMWCYVHTSVCDVTEFCYRTGWVEILTLWCHEMMSLRTFTYVALVVSSHFSAISG